MQSASAGPIMRRYDVVDLSSAHGIRKQHRVARVEFFNRKIVQTSADEFHRATIRARLECAC
jgi:hypothetical protein